MKPLNKFLSSMPSEKPILSDGAMGTVLHSRGIRFDDCFDELKYRTTGYCDGCPSRIY